ncbi:hypothetical protein TNCV_2450861 [Trichonephila clavipes]|nr:hypothetical protein TNCV_2450861 [Trichonephila clavipes]
MKSLVYASPVDSDEALVAWIAVVAGDIQEMPEVSDLGLPCHEFEPSTTKDPPCRAAMHVKSVESCKRPPVGVVW